MLNLFGEDISEKDAVRVRIYADEIQEIASPVTGEKWIYTGAIYENVNKPILEPLLDIRYRKDLPGWEEYRERNDSEIHWTDIRKEVKKRDVVNRWLNYLYTDSLSERRFYFSILGINLTNLNIEEFDNRQIFNSVYNRFFRSMLKSCLPRYFGKNVVVEDIFHEQGPQQDHTYFDWHTIYKLNQEEGIYLEQKPVCFLPKNHRDDERSNVIQLIDVLLGVYKDLHLGVNPCQYGEIKQSILDHPFINEVLIQRVIRKPQNMNSKFGYVNRFNISLFPNLRTDPNSFDRLKDSYYNISNVRLEYLHQHQATLF
jgi:hypothetical protein